MPRDATALGDEVPDVPSFVRTRIGRKAERARYDRDAVHSILDAALYCHVGMVRDGAPVVLPTIHARDGHTVLLHGSFGAGYMRGLKCSTALCVSVTLVDGLVLSRAVRSHSMNYRSAVVFGEGALITDDREKLRPLEIITERIAPGRWTVTRPPTEVELRGEPEPAPFSPAGSSPPEW